MVVNKRYPIIGGPNTIHPMYRNKDPIKAQTIDKKTSWYHRGVMRPKNTLSPMISTSPARKPH
jgi:hypothetical protein